MANLPHIYPVRAPDRPFSPSIISSFEHASMLYVVRCKTKKADSPDWFCLMHEYGISDSVTQRTFFFLTNQARSPDYHCTDLKGLACPGNKLLENVPYNLSALDLPTAKCIPYALIQSMEQADRVFVIVRHTVESCRAVDCPFESSKLVVEDLVDALRNFGVFREGRVLWNGCEHPDIDLDEIWVEKVEHPLIVASLEHEGRIRSGLALRRPAGDDIMEIGDDALTALD
ncbi:MAG: hypothetical protein M1829_002369 [Trizodia sp. TS-e1964]|nr:MAG: hypothetical protein M1829_002369 [Trizodia sp. TS-e1964]